jgi:hypothetical protein
MRKIKLLQNIDNPFVVLHAVINIPYLSEVTDMTFQIPSTAVHCTRRVRALGCPFLHFSSCW